jgi:hypothetical protein
VEERPRTPGALQPDASSAPVAGPEADSADAKADGGGVDRTPQTNEEWTAFAALPPGERAVLYLRSLPTALVLLGAPVFLGALAFVGG